MVLLRSRVRKHFKYMMANKKGMKIMMPGAEKNPRIELTSDQYPDIKDWEVGKTYTVEVELKAKHKEEGQKYSFDVGNKGQTRMSFEVISVKEDSAEEDKAESKK